MKCVGPLFSYSYIPTFFVRLVKIMAKELFKIHRDFEPAGDPSTRAKLGTGREVVVL